MNLKIPSHLLAVLMLGIVSQVGQVLLLRELLMVFHGNELSIGLILAAWLVWVGAGSRLGAFLVEKVNRSTQFLLLLSSAGLLLALPATIIVVRGLRGFFDVMPGAYLSLADMILSCFAVMAPAGLLLGAQFVLLSKIWRQLNRAEDTSGAEKTYIGEAAGNMLGGIFFTFLMVHYLNPLQSAVLVGALMLAAFLALTQKKGEGTARKPLRVSLALAGVLAITVLSFPFLEQLDNWAYRVQWDYFAPEHRLIETQQSRYGLVSVAQLEDQYSFFQSGHLVFSTAGPETTLPGLEEQEAVDFAHLAMVQHKNPERILLLGGGLRGTLSEILKHPVKRIDYIELDEVLTEAARPHLPAQTRKALDDPRSHLIHTDGRLFVKTAQEKYDMIIVDNPDPFTAELNRYYTEEFFREVKALLHPDGVFVTGATSTPDLRGTAIANRNTAIYHTLGTVFSQVLPAGDRFMFYFSSDDPGQVSIDPHILQERYLKRDVEAPGFSPRRFFTLLEETQLQRVNWVVRNHGRSPHAHLKGPGVVPPFPGTLEEQEKKEAQLRPVERRYFINSDFKPIGYYYTLMFWEDLTREGHGPSLKQLLHVEPWWILPPVILLLLVPLGLRATSKNTGKKPVSNFAVLFTAFATGLSTMSLQVALLFSFQSVYGFVYEIVGLITAMFMCGLAAGAFFTHRYIADKANTRTLALVQLFMAVLALFISVALPGAAGIQSPAAVFLLFSVLTFVAGLINGVDFPLAAACYMALQQRAEKSAGTIYGIELFGACIGAILASAVVAPILGIAACCLLAGIASGTAYVILFISRRFELHYA